MGILKAGFGFDNPPSLGPRVPKVTRAPQTPRGPRRLYFFTGRKYHLRRYVRPDQSSPCIKHAGITFVPEYHPNVLRDSFFSDRIPYGM